MSTEAPDHQDFPGPATETHPAPGQDLWKLRDLVLLIAFVPIDLFISNVVAFSGYALLKPLMGWHTNLHALQDNPLFLLSLQTIFYAFLFVYIYLLVSLHYRSPFWATLNWGKLTLRRAVRFFFGGVALSLLVMISPAIFQEKKNFPLEKMFGSPADAYAIAAFAVLVAPFMEELLFRGVLFAFFERNGGMKFAILGTAVLFAGLHVPEYWGAWNHVLLILAVGVVLSLARGLTGSLTPSVILHLAYNATLMAMLYLQTDHFRKLPEVIFR